MSVDVRHAAAAAAAPLLLLLLLLLLPEQLRWNVYCSTLLSWAPAAAPIAVDMVCTPTAAILLLQCGKIALDEASAAVAELMLIISPLLLLWCCCVCVAGRGMAMISQHSRFPVNLQHQKVGNTVL